VKKILILFPSDWDRRELERARYRSRYRFIYHGPDFFRFPGNLRLLAFDARRFVERAVDRCRRERFDGVLSTDEYLGALIAAVVARRCRLPGADPARIALAQHKLLSREAQQTIAPEAIPEFRCVPIDDRAAAEIDLPFPIFLKPAKGTYSVLARRVDSADEAVRHLRFGPLERFYLRRLVRPFNDLLRTYTDLGHDASSFIGEELIEGVQVTVDGFACGGSIEIAGVVDSVMVPGTPLFQRFEYPSRLDSSVQRRMEEVARRVIAGIGFGPGQFNIEMAYNEKTGAIKIIEINPRMSYQFADLYEKVDGCNSYDHLLDLTLGRRPRLRRGAGRYTCAASFVFRTWHGEKLKNAPARTQVETLGERRSGSTLKIYGRAGFSLAWEMKALGSCRYAVVNAGALSRSDLFAAYRSAAKRLECTLAST
jgi:hypothetical protein